MHWHHSLTNQNSKVLPKVRETWKFAYIWIYNVPEDFKTLYFGQTVITPPHSGQFSSNFCQNLLIQLNMPDTQFKD